MMYWRLVLAFFFLKCCCVSAGSPGWSLIADTAGSATKACVLEDGVRKALNLPHGFVNSSLTNITNETECQQWCLNANHLVTHAQYHAGSHCSCFLSCNLNRPRDELSFPAKIYELNIGDCVGKFINTASPISIVNDVSEVDGCPTITSLRWKLIHV